jgi:hypothetical protein
MRRADPRRIFEARREALRSRMVSSWRVAPDDADSALDALDLIATGRALLRDDPRYWSEGEAWMRDKCGITDPE